MVQIESLLAGAQRANEATDGAIVIIDVFRAFTTAAVAFSRGASRIVMVSDAEEALALRASGAGDLCIGEVSGRPYPGFDYANSPHQLESAPLAGKTLIQRTSAGTQGISAVRAALERGVAVYAGALVTANATARAIDSSASILVAMGDKGTTRADEDELCAIHLRNLIEGRPGNPTAVRDAILAGGRIGDFTDPDIEHLPRQDLDIALDVSRYDFAIRVRLEAGQLVARQTGAA